MVSASTDLRDSATPDSLTLSKSSLQKFGEFWELLQSGLYFSVLQSCGKPGLGSRTHQEVLREGGNGHSGHCELGWPT